MKAVKVILDEGVQMPQYETEGAAGFDLRAVSVLQVYRGSLPVSSEKLKKIQEGFLERDFLKVRDFERVLFGTGIKMEIPRGMELQIRPRSGISLKKGLTVANSPGTVDSDYRGEIGIILVNTSQYLATVEKGERIAQGVFSLVEQPEMEVTLDFDTMTERGADGFGSTGNF